MPKKKKEWPRTAQAPEDEENDRCDLDPDKICDNCMKCVLGDADYRAIEIDGIELESEYIRKHGKA